MFNPICYLSRNECFGLNKPQKYFQAVVTRSTIWADNQVLSASALNGEFNNLLNALALTNSDISGGAAIVESKILFSGTGHGHTGGTDGKIIATLTKPTINGSVQAYTTDVDGATVTFDMTASNVHTVTLGGNRTLAVSNVTSGQIFTLILKQGSGGQTVTWFSSIKWVGASVPTLSTTGSRWDIFTFIYDGTNYYGSIVGQNFG